MLLDIDTISMAAWVMTSILIYYKLNEIIKVKSMETYIMFLKFEVLVFICLSSGAGKPMWLVHALSWAEAVVYRYPGSKSIVPMCRECLWRWNICASSYMMLPAWAPWLLLPPSSASSLPSISSAILLVHGTSIILAVVNNPEFCFLFEGYWAGPLAITCWCSAVSFQGSIFIILKDYGFGQSGEQSSALLAASPSHCIVHHWG